MAAATVSNSKSLTAAPFFIRQHTFSSMTSDQKETLTHGGPSGATAFKVEYQVTTRPTSGDTLNMEWSASDTDNDTVTLRFYAEQGGDLAGAVVDVLVYWLDQASGGITVS